MISRLSRSPPDQPPISFRALPVRRHSGRLPGETGLWASGREGDHCIFCAASGSIPVVWREEPVDETRQQRVPFGAAAGVVRPLSSSRGFAGSVFPESPSKPTSCTPLSHGCSGVHQLPMASVQARVSRCAHSNRYTREWDGSCFLLFFLAGGQAGRSEHLGRVTLPVWSQSLHSTCAEIPSAARLSGRATSTGIGRTA